MARVLWTQHLKRAMASGASVITRDGEPVTLAPRSTRDRRPWLDGSGGRWAGSECRAVYPQPQPERPRRELPPGVARRRALLKRYEETGINWDDELGEAS